MGKKREFKLNVGASSILLTIVVFALAVFAVLSVRASNSDLILARRTKEAIRLYYEADSKAEKVLMEIDQVLENYYNDTSGIALKVQLQNAVAGKGWVKAQSDKVGIICYSIGMNHYATLEVAVAYNMQVGTNKYYDVIKWKVNQKEIGSYDFSDFTYWDGTIKEQ